MRRFRRRRALCALAGVLSPTSALVAPGRAPFSSTRPVRMDASALPLVSDYSAALLSHPLETKAFTQAALWSVSDCIAQRRLEQQPLDLARTAKFATTGLGSAVLWSEWFDVVDAVVMWWRDDDGDLVDGLVDAIGPLADHGVIWLMTPKPGREGHIESEDIADAAPTAGLQQTSTISAGSFWQGTRLVAPRSKR